MISNPKEDVSPSFYVEMTSVLNIKCSDVSKRKKQDIQAYILYASDILKSYANQLCRAAKKSRLSIVEISNICDNLKDFDEKILGGIEQIYTGTEKILTL